MKKTVIAMFCLAAGVAWAQEDNDTESELVEELDFRIAVIENIDVTAEKPPAVSADETDTDIDAILDEVEALEVDEE